MHTVTSKDRSTPPPCLDERIYNTHRCSVIRHAINSYQPRTLARHLSNPILMVAYSYIRLLLSGIQFISCNISDSSLLRYAKEVIGFTLM